MINKNAAAPTLSSYFNDVFNLFYEDTGLMRSVGLTFGFDVDRDFFLALSFLYPSDVAVSYDERCALRTMLAPVAACGPLNRAIDPPQFFLCDKGAMLILIAHKKDELLAALGPACAQAAAILERELPDVFVRIGTGTCETGLEGIRRSCQNSVNAVNAGEKFKKTRRVLDFLGMEIYSAINAMVISYGHSLTDTILSQLTSEEQTILGKYYKCKEEIPAVAASLSISEEEVAAALRRVKEKTGLDVNDTEDNFKLNFVMIARRVLEKEKRRR